MPGGKASARLSHGVVFGTIQCKYRYKMAIKNAIANADKIFNDDL